MRNLGFISLFAVSILLLLFSTAIFSKDENTPQKEEPMKGTEELPILADLSQLELKVVNTEKVDKIGNVDMRGNAALGEVRPKKEAKMVVVTLEGAAKSACKIPLMADSFEAVYNVNEKEVGTLYSQRGEILMSLLRRAVRSLGVNVSNGSNFWLVITVRKNEDGVNETMSTNGEFYIREPGPITIKVAFALPEDISIFTIRYPTAIQEATTISAQ